MPRVAAYTRLSLDQTGAQTATSRQEAACRSLAAARGWRVVEVFEDVDVSAYQARVVRPAYERLVRQVEDHTIDGVLVWKLDRLVRRPAEFERFWLACETAGVFLASVTEPVDSSTEIGLALVRVLVTFASLESATSGLRLRAKFRQLAEQGRPHGGRPPFGFTADRTDVVPEEAGAIRDAAKRILAGESTSSLCRDWAERGITTRNGNPWTPNRLMDMLCAARMVGDRSWHGEEIVARDCFPAILDRATQLRLRRLRASRAVGRYQRREQTLLSRLVVCGECETRMHVRRNQYHRLYSCPSAPAGCGHVHVVGPLLEEYTVNALFEWLRDSPPPPPRRFRFDEGAYGELVARLEQLHRDYHVDRAIDRDSYLNCRAEIDDRLRSLANQTSLPPIEGLPRGFDLRYTKLAWPALNAEQRRTIAVAEIMSVTIRGARVRRFDPSRIEISWRRAPPPTGRASRRCD